MQLFDATKAAELIGCVPFTVRKLATKHTIGSRVGRTWAFTAAEVEKLRRTLQEPGNPTMRDGTEAERAKLARKGVRAKRAKQRKEKG